MTLKTALVAGILGALVIAMPVTAEDILNFTLSHSGDVSDRWSTTVNYDERKSFTEVTNKRSFIKSCHQLVASDGSVASSVQTGTFWTGFKVDVTKIGDVYQFNSVTSDLLNLTSFQASDGCKFQVPHLRQSATRIALAKDSVDGAVIHTIDERQIRVHLNKK